MCQRDTGKIVKSSIPLGLIDVFRDCDATKQSWRRSYILYGFQCTCSRISFPSKDIPKSCFPTLFECLANTDFDSGRISPALWVFLPFQCYDPIPIQVVWTSFRCPSHPMRKLRNKLLYFEGPVIPALFNLKWQFSIAHVNRSIVAFDSGD
jgi:hypothetical protein